MTFNRLLLLCAYCTLSFTARADALSCVPQESAISPGLRIAAGTTLVALGSLFVAGGVALEADRNRSTEGAEGGLGDVVEFGAFAFGALGLAGGIYALASPGLSRPCPALASRPRPAVGPGAWLWPAKGLQ